MYSCSGCGGNLRYDIKSGNLVCDFCGNSQAPQDHPDTLLTAAENEYDVTVYTCPQCGGELYSTGLEAASFCMYCGSSVALSGRLSRETSPQKIIPFRKTAESVKEAYQKMTRKVWFLPKELKNTEHLEKFQPIYLPYWIYSVDQKGPIALKGVRSKSNYTEYCDINLDLDADYSFIPFDASAAMDDDLSQKSAPFHEKELVDFSPAYLCGFYADYADVPDKTYLDDARKEANDRTILSIERSSGSGEMTGMKITRPENENEALHSHVNNTRSALFPFWFLTWRNNDRVAYAVANGETGRVVADLPVDKRAYYLCSLGLSAVLALILYLLPVMQAETVLMISTYVSAFILWIFVFNQKEMTDKDTHALDKGYQAKHTAAAGASAALLHGIGGAAAQNPDAEKASREPKKFPLTKCIPPVAVLFLIPYVIKIILGTFNFVMATATTMRIIGTAAWPIVCVCFVILLHKAVNLERRLPGRRTLADTLIGMAALTAAGFVLVLRNPSDVFNYSAVILLLIVICYLITRLINGYNLLSTRPVPEFHQRKGGASR